MIATPSEATLKAARDAWLVARNPYQETEVYRFGNPIVDEWEGKVNAWPLDEGLIDYVDPSYGTESDENALFTANVIANKTIKIDGKDVDATNITPEFLSGTLQEAGGIEANVATGYHAIEFLLWGQDLNGTGKGAGNRPYTDYRHQELHQRQLRPPRRLSEGRKRRCSSPTSRRWSPTGRRRARPPRPSTADPKAGLAPSSPAWARCPTANSPASA